MHKKGVLILNTFDKIDFLLKQNKKKQIDLTNFLGVSKATYSSWKSGRTASFHKHLPLIAEFLNVTTDYLLAGSDKAVPPKPFNITEDEKRLIAAYRNQSEEGKKMVRKLLDLDEPTNRVIDDLTSDPITDLQTTMTNAFTKTTT